MYGRKGVAINLVSSNDMEMLGKIERFYNTQITELPADYSDLF
tara:strand:- start:39 stop:167 length:129 start_codon:yes stop_codon:yes gene_type:complete